MPDPASQSWPALVANKLGTDLINLGRPAYSNDTILRDLILQDLQGPPDRPEPDLVIVCWTSYLRLEFVDDFGCFSTLPNNKETYGRRKEVSDFILVHADDEWLYSRWLTQVILLQEYLIRSKHVKYLFFNAFDNYHQYDRYKKKFRSLIDKIDKTLFIGWPDQGMVEWAYPSPIGPRGHPLELGHQKVADHLLENLKSIYDLG